MLERPSESESNWVIPQSAIATLLLALALSIGYFAAPRWREDWPPAFHPLMWTFVGGLVLYAVVRLIDHGLPRRWRDRWQSMQRHKAHIAAEGIGYVLIMVVLFVGSSLTHSNMLMLVFSAMAGPFIINGSVTLMMLKNISISRRPPRRAMAGEMFSVELELSNHSQLLPAWLLTAADRVADAAAVLYPKVLFARVGPQTAVIGHYQVRLIHRGKHDFGPLEVRSRFPLGLVERSFLFGDVQQTLVYPRIGRLTRAWKRQLLSASELVEQSQPRAGIFDDEFHHLREYRFGDNPRSIHWRSSARRQQVIVRDYQQNRDHDLLVVVDLHQPATPTRLELDAVELALSFVATVCLEHRSQCRGAHLTVAVVGKETWRWEGTASASAFEDLFDKLALSTAGSAEAFGAELSDVMATLSSHVRTVVVTTRAIPPSALPQRARSRQQVHWMSIDPGTIQQWMTFDDAVSPTVKATTANGAAASGTAALPRSKVTAASSKG
jgi:uncharacterized protein (DUF58 family)